MKHCTLREELRQERAVVDGCARSVWQAGDCHQQSRRRLPSKESNGFLAPRAASVVLCSGIVETKATGLRAAQ